LTRQAVGKLHCSVVARIKLAPCALATFEVAKGGVQEIDQRLIVGTLPEL
jgi:hypothetical protein